MIASNAFATAHSIAVGECIVIDLLAFLGGVVYVLSELAAQSNRLVLRGRQVVKFWIAFLTQKTLLIPIDASVIDSAYGVG